MHIQTAAVHTLKDFEHGAVVPPVHLASTFELDRADEEGAFAYQRGANPTRTQLETVLAALEGAGHGFAFASGMAATAVDTVEFFTSTRENRAPTRRQAWATALLP